MNVELLSFYRGEGESTRAGGLRLGQNTGRRLSDILAWDNIALEVTHDYIQWAFPLKEASDHNHSAPLLDDETIEAFKTDLLARQNVEKMTLRIAEFLELPADTKLGYVNFSSAIKTPHWIDQYNHNYKRATRIIASLRLMGFEESAKSLFNSLYDLYLKHGETIGVDTFAFWQKAATAPINELKFR